MKIILIYQFRECQSLFKELSYLLLPAEVAPSVTI